MSPVFATTVAGLSYLVAAALFLLGLQRMASPVTARSGIQWAGIGMVIATVATFLLPGLHNMALIVVGAILAAGSGALDRGTILGAVAVALVAINTFGGFLVTERMLEMFKKKDSTPKGTHGSGEKR